MKILTDKIEKIRNTLIQHGKKNNRVYIMNIDHKKEDIKDLIKDINILAEKNSYTKVFAQVSEELEEEFKQSDYIVEASIPKFFNNEDKCFFMSKFFNRNRGINKSSELTDQVLEVAKAKEICNNLKLDAKYKIEKCNEENIENICKLYGEVFETYPFPIFDPEYIKSTMNDNVIYFGVWDGDILAAVSAIEIDKKDRNAEMTDFSTHHNYRGENLSMYLLYTMELELKVLKIPTAYTIARATSFAMNNTFKKLDYKYGGTLMNNTNIGGQIESMNVWYKNINI